MRTIYAIFIISIAILCTACRTNELTRGQNEYVFSHTVQLSKAELKSKIISFVSEHYMSENSFVRSKENGLISGNVTSPQLGLISKLQYSFAIHYQEKYYDVVLVVRRIYRGSEEVSSSQWGSYADKVKNEFNTFDYELFSALSK